LTGTIGPSLPTWRCGTRSLRDEPFIAMVFLDGLTLKRRTGNVNG